MVSFRELSPQVGGIDDRVQRCIRLDQAPLQGGPADVIGQDIQFTAGQTGSETAVVKWIGGSPENAVS